MFYTLFIPVLILALLELRYLSRLQKHDEVLFRFCEVRRQITRVLRDEAETISAEDYGYARHLLEVTSHTIHFYNEYKRSVFDYRAYITFLRAYRVSSKQFVELPKTDHARLRQIEGELGRAIFLGFWRFTPFFRSELTARLIVFLLIHAMALAAKHGNHRIESLREVLEIYRAQAQQFGGPQLGVAG